MKLASPLSAAQAWEAEEKRKAQLQKDIMARLKLDREAQLQERTLRKRLVGGVGGVQGTVGGWRLGHTTHGASTVITKSTHTPLMTHYPT